MWNAPASPVRFEGAPLLSAAYYTNALMRRNEIALFTLHHCNEVDPKRMELFDGLSLEPRLRRLAMPLSIIFQLWPQGKDQFRNYLVARQ